MSICSAGIFAPTPRNRQLKGAPGIGSSLTKVDSSIIQLVIDSIVAKYENYEIQELFMII